MKHFYFVEKGVRSQVVNQTASANELRMALQRCNTEQLISSHRSFDPDGEVKKRMLCLIVGEHIEGQPLTRLDANFRHGSHILLDFDEPCDPAVMAAMFVQRLAAGPGLAEVVSHCYIEESVSGKIHLLAPRLSDDVGEDIFAYSEFFFGDGGDDPMFDRTCKNTSRLCILTGHALTGSCLENLQRDIPAGLLSALRAAVYGEDATLVTPVSEATHPESDQQNERCKQSAEQYCGLDLSLITDCLLAKLGGIPSLGQRNQVLYMLAKELLSITDNNEAIVAQLIGPYKWFGLPETEARGTIHSAAKKYEPQRRHTAIMDKALSQALARGVACTVRLSNNTTVAIPQTGDGEEEGISTISNLTSQADATTLSLPLEQSSPAVSSEPMSFNPFCDMPPQMPEFRKLPKVVRHLIQNVPEQCYAHVLNSAEAALATYLVDTRITDLAGQPRGLGSGWLCYGIAPMSCGKESRVAVTDSILKELVENDAVVRRSIMLWKDESSRKRSSDVETERPSFNSQILGADCTAAAFTQRLRDLEHGALIADFSELSQGAGLQTNAGDTATPLLLAFDEGKLCVERSSDVGVSANVTVRLNIIGQGTPFQARCFFGEGSYSKGLYSRGSYATIIESDMADEDAFVYGSYDDAYQAETDRYVALLKAAQSQHLVCKKADEHARKMRHEAFCISAAYNSESLRVLARRQALIQQKRAYLYWLLNGRRWTQELELFLEWRFRYALFAIYYLFGSQIDKEQAAEASAMARRSPGMTNWLEALPEVFDTEMLKNLRRIKNVAIDEKSIRHQLACWRNRHLIADDAQPGQYINLKKRSAGC